MENSGKRPRIRSNLLVYPQFQMALILVNILISILTFGINLFQTSRAFDRFYELGHSIQLAPDHAFFKLIELQGNRVYSYMIWSFLIAIGISCLMMTLLSHRLAGPIVRLRSYFRDIAAKGKIQSELKFREGDFFSDLPEAINSALKEIRK